MATLTRFIKGINADIKHEVKLLSPQTFEEAYQMGMNLTIGLHPTGIKLP